MAQILITDARIADSGSLSESGSDVLIQNSQIVSIGPSGTFGSRDAIRVVRAEGRVLSPGFIDTHSHEDHAPLLDDDDTSKVLQGITTEVNGNCGFSLAPIATSHSKDFVSLVERIFPPLNYQWSDFRGYIDTLAQHEFVTNFVNLIGHNTVRIAAMGSDNRPPTEAEFATMEKFIDEGIEAGAAGLSTGLIYPPGTFSTEAEVIRLAKRLPKSAVYTSHMRNESRHLLASVRETIDIARAAGVHCHISHLKMADRRRPGKLAEALDYIDEERRTGMAITQDIYPYAAASTMLTALLPPWMHDGGADATLARLGSASVVSEVAKQIADPQADFENFGLQAGWENVVISTTDSHRFEGESIAAIAHRMKADPTDVVVKILREEKLKATMIVHAMREEDVELALRHPNTMIGTDGLPVGTGGRPHPRGYGSFPRVLEHYVRDQGVLSLAEALRRFTALPAQTFGLQGRGRVKEGYVADLVLLDPDTLADNATFTHPTAPPKGIDDVFIAGERVVENGRWMGRRVGKYLPARH